MKAHSLCPSCVASSASQGPKSGSWVGKGSYYRRSDGKWVKRYYCLKCKRSLSSATFSSCYRQKKRHLNDLLFKLLCSGVSQRRAALILGISRTTVVRKFLFLAKQARLQQKAYLDAHLASGKKMSRVYFDEMESFERSKCLPVSIPIAIHPENRKIIGFRVCEMPAKGPLSKLSRQKYGPRADERPFAAEYLWKELKHYLSETPEISTDQNPQYPSWIKPHLPNAILKSFKGRRGCVVGQGELKRGGFDPLFELNHTAAMIRANVNRLFRRTWCTTKLKERLEDHLAIYSVYHNQVLT